jgi:hypothetical protein
VETIVLLGAQQNTVPDLGSLVTTQIFVTSTKQSTILFPKMA